MNEFIKLERQLSKYFRKFFKLPSFFPNPGFVNEFATQDLIVKGNFWFNSVTLNNFCGWSVIKVKLKIRYKIFQNEV